MDMNKIPDEHIEGPAAWVSAELAGDESSWLMHLSSEQVQELESAARYYLALGRDIGEIKAEDFPLFEFGDYLKSLRQKLLQGNGVEVIRGLPVADYSQEFIATIFCGIGSHIGSARSQNAAGHILGHVRDTGASSKESTTRIYQTAERQSFHTDSADVVGLCCLREAREGGLSLLVSALSIFNRMREIDPELLALLFEPIATDRRGEVPEGAEPYTDIPVLNWFAGYLTVYYQRQYIDSAQRFAGAPRLTDKHIAALDLFDALAHNPELHFTMQLEPGDLQFVYNHSQLHDRTAFIDRPDPDQRRHLLRLWLSVEGDRPLPECFKQRYGSIDIGDRGGIITAETRLHAPLD